MSVTIKMPKYVQEVITRLENAGYEAYIVGGCVRDSLLRIEPNDWDVCTSALPDKIVEIFSDKVVIKTGIKHGTVTVIIGGHPCEITTFRIDGEYSDGRHPDEVKFSTSIEEDLSRRDFTINAMAYNPNKGLIDPFGGENDLWNEKVKCVGSSKKRFEEDSLRILRAVRFAVKYRFNIDTSTQYSMQHNSGALFFISKERVVSEFYKLLAMSSDSICKYTSLIFDLYKVVISEFATLDFDEFEKILKLTDFLDDDKIVYIRLALLIEDGNMESLRNLKLSNKDIGIVENTQNAGKMLLNYAPYTKQISLELENVIGEFGYDIAEYAVTYMHTKYKITHNMSFDFHNECIGIIKNHKRNNTCLSVKQLVINGNDLKQLGLSGKSIGDMLERVLLSIRFGNIRNNRNDILYFVNDVMQHFFESHE